MIHFFHHFKVVLVCTPFRELSMHIKFPFSERNRPEQPCACPCPNSRFIASIRCYPLLVTPTLKGVRIESNKPI